MAAAQAEMDAKVKGAAEGLKSATETAAESKEKAEAGRAAREAAEAKQPALVAASATPVPLPVALAVAPPVAATSSFSFLILLNSFLIFSLDLTRLITCSSASLCALLFFLEACSIKANESTNALHILPQ